MYNASLTLCRLDWSKGSKRMTDIDFQQSGEDDQREWPRYEAEQDFALRHLYLMTGASYEFAHKELHAFKETIFPSLAAA